MQERSSRVADSVSLGAYRWTRTQKAVVMTALAVMWSVCLYLHFSDKITSGWHSFVKVMKGSHGVEKWHLIALGIGGAVLSLLGMYGIYRVYKPIEQKDDLAAEIQGQKGPALQELGAMREQIAELKKLSGELRDVTASLPEATRAAERYKLHVQQWESEHQQTLVSLEQEVGQDKDYEAKDKEHMQNGHRIAQTVHTPEALSGLYVDVRVDSLAHERQGARESRAERLDELVQSKAELEKRCVQATAELERLESKKTELEPQIARLKASIEDMSLLCWKAVMNEKINEKLFELEDQLTAVRQERTRLTLDRLAVNEEKGGRRAAQDDDEEWKEEPAAAGLKRIEENLRHANERFRKIRAEKSILEETQKDIRSGKTHPCILNEFLSDEGDEVDALNDAVFDLD